MRKVKTLEEVNQVFDLLGIKEVGKRCQHKRGNYVYELPFKTCYVSGSTVPIKFAVYTTGYVRRVEGAYTCYQINKIRKKPEYFKDYKWNEEQTKQHFTGKYRQYMSSKRILIDKHEDRMVYLCNYILKNFYGKGATNKYIICEYTKSLLVKRHDELNKTWLEERENFDSNDCSYEESPKPQMSFCSDDVKVIINGHRYNLS